MTRERHPLRHSYFSVTACIIVAAIAMLAGHLFRVQSPQGLTPFLSANDRSRWATVRALLEHSTYSLDEVSFTTPLPEDTGGPQSPRAKRDPEWHSIDMVRHRGADGREHFYSSKPPLLATAVAGVCRVVELATGARLADNPKYVGRLTLVFVNLVPLSFALWLLARMLASTGRTQAGRLFVLVAASFGTLLGPMAVTLNNHVPAAVATQIAVFATWRLLSNLGNRKASTSGNTDSGVSDSGVSDSGVSDSGAAIFQSPTGQLGMAAALRGWRDRLASGGWREYGWSAAAGGAAALATAFELPALSLLAVLGLVVGAAAPRGMLLGFLPAASMVGALALGLNFVAHGEWRPAYANRADGPVVATIAEKPWYASTTASARVAPAVRDVLRQAGLEVSDHATHRTATPAADGATRWTLWDPETHRRWAVVAASERVECREWRNWYDYEGTYWTPERLRGVDRGEPSRWAYLFHATLGHHGVFSVTPVWLLSLLGGCLAWRRGFAPRGLSPSGRTQQGLTRQSPTQQGPAHQDMSQQDTSWQGRSQYGSRQGGEWQIRLWAAVAAVLTVVCLSFYVARPLIDRNYGGVSCGFRWLFWLIPLWCLPMVAAADVVLRGRWSRLGAVCLLAASVFSAAWSATKPWSHPWIYEYWASLGWLGEL